MMPRKKLKRIQKISVSRKTCVLQKKTKKDLKIRRYDLSQELITQLLKIKKNEMQNFYYGHFMPMLKHLEHQIFHRKMRTMGTSEQSEFLRNILDPEGIKDANKALVLSHRFITS